jgi:hypothetical protein
MEYIFKPQPFLFRLVSIYNCVIPPSLFHHLPSQLRDLESQVSRKGLWSFPSTPSLKEQEGLLHAKSLEVYKSQLS